LTQDVGFDQSLFTQEDSGRPVLVRNVVSHGQVALRVGLLKEVRFAVDPASTIDLTYQIRAYGAGTSATLTVACDDGAKYVALLPVGDGYVTAHISGSELHVPAKHSLVAAIVIEAGVRAPVYGAENRLAIQSFEIHGSKRASLRIRYPDIATSADGEARVAGVAFTSRKPVVIEIDPAPVAGSLEIADGAGTRRFTVDVPAGADRATIPHAVTAHPGLWEARLSSGMLVSAFHFLVAGDAPPHPRLLIGASRLEALRRDERLRTVVHQRATDLEATIVVSPGAGENIKRLSSTEVFSGQAMYFRLMQNYSNAISYNALDYRLNNDRHALDVARRVLLVMCGWETWTPPWHPAHGTSAYYEVGVATEKIAFGYDLIAAELLPEERAKVVSALWHNSIEPTVADYFTNDRMPSEASNHQAQSVGGALAAIGAAYGDAPEWDARLSGALARLSLQLERLLHGLLPGDGSEAEPVGYQDFSMQGISYGLAGLHVFGVRPQGSDQLAQAFWEPRYMQVSPAYFLESGDTAGILEVRSGYAWVTELSDSGDLRAFYNSASDRCLNPSSQRESGLHSDSAGASATGSAAGPAAAPPAVQCPLNKADLGLDQFLDLVCCSKEAAAPASVVPSSRVFAGHGTAALRTGWGPTDTLISLRVGPWFNHEHHDQGSFQVAAFGEVLIGEAGYSDYYRDPRYADYFTEAAGHNTILVDGDPFSQSGYDGRKWRAFADYPHFTATLLSDKIDYLAADLASAYRPRLKAFSREYLFLKPDLLIVNDRLQAEGGAHRYDWLLHVPPGLDVELDGQRATIRGHAASATIVSASDEQWLVQDTPIPLDAYTEFDRGQIPRRQELMLTSPPKSQAQMTVGMELNGARDGNAALRPLTTLSGTGFRRSAGTAQQQSALFRTQPGLLEIDGFESDGDLLAVMQNDNLSRVLAIRARSVRRNRESLIDSDRPMSSMVLDLGTDSVEVALNCDQAVAIQVGARKLREFLADGKPVRVLAGAPTATIALTQGAHHLRLRF